MGRYTPMNTKYIATLILIDPDTNTPVKFEIRKNVTDGSFIGFDVNRIVATAAAGKVLTDPLTHRPLIIDDDNLRDSNFIPSCGFASLRDFEQASDVSSKAIVWSSPAVWRHEHPNEEQQLDNKFTE